MIATVDSVLEQLGDFEIIVVQQEGMQPMSHPAGQVRVISSEEASRGGLLNAGANAATGELLLFLWPGNRLPVEALITIEKNFSILPQTIGGNFHVIFNIDTPAAALVTRFLKMQRYKGHYYGNSGIFTRKDVYAKLGGFKPYNILEDYNFGQRLEKHGPTLYLPDKIIAPANKLQHKTFRAAIAWLIVLPFSKIKVSPNTLASIANTIIGK